MNAHLGDLLRDLRHGARLLRRAPGFALAAAACLGIGIGLATAMFTQFQASIFKSTPGVAVPDALVSFQAPVSYPDFEECRDHSGQFTAAAAFLAPVPFVLSVQGQSERIWGHIVTPDYFRVLGVTAVAGRLFGPGETAPGSTAAVISHRLWETRFGGRADLVGRTLRVNGQAVTIVGVAARDFVGATPLLAAADLWIPTSAPARVAPELAGDVLRDPHLKIFQVVGRLRPGVATTEAETALDALARRLERTRGDADRDRGGRRVTLLPGGRVFPVRDQDLPAIVAFPAVLTGLVLLVACMNVATMLVARGAARRREVAIRLALGAGRARLVRQLLTESALLALLGGGAGLLFVVGYHRVMETFLAILPAQMQYTWNVDWRVWAATGVFAGACALVFGLAPALQAARAEIAPALKVDATPRLRAARWFSLRHGLVVLQVAGSLALLLLTTFALLGFQRTKAIKLGFEPGNLFLLSLDPVRDGYTPQQAADFFARLPERLRRLPGVRAAALAQSSPFGLDAGEAMMATKSDLVSGPQLVQSLRTERVGAGFFETLGVPRLAGRTFREADERENVPVVVVNQTLAEETWPGRSGVGETLELDGVRHEVIGVVGDIGTGFSLGRRLRCAYLPDVPGGYAAPSAQGVTLVVRAERGADIPLLVRRDVGAMLANLTVFNTTSMTEQVERMASVFRIATAIYGGIGLFGLVLAAVGLAGVTAYTVARRTHEIGIRRALGAQSWDVLRLVMQEGVVLVVVGTGLGLAGAMVAVRVMSTVLSAMEEIMRTSTHDPLVLIGAPALLAGVALLACYLPARRSLRINPVEALRAE